MGVGGVYREVLRPSASCRTSADALVIAAFTEKDGMTTVATTLCHGSGEAREILMQAPIERGLAELRSRGVRPVAPGTYSLHFPRQ